MLKTFLRNAILLCYKYIYNVNIQSFYHILFYIYNTFKAISNLLIGCKRIKVYTSIIIISCSGVVDGSIFWRFFFLCS